MNARVQQFAEIDQRNFSRRALAAQRRRAVEARAAGRVKHGHTRSYQWQHAPAPEPAPPLPVRQAPFPSLDAMMLMRDEAVAIPRVTLPDNFLNEHTDVLSVAEDETYDVVFDPDFRWASWPKTAASAALMHNDERNWRS